MSSSMSSSIFDDAPPTPLVLERTLSHQYSALRDSKPYFDELKEGQTIFANYFFSRLSHIMEVDYYQRVNGEILQCRIQEPWWFVQQYPWDFYSAEMPDIAPYYGMSNNIVLEQPLVLKPTSSHHINY